MKARTLPDNLKEQFDDRGFVILEGVIDRHVLAAVRRDLTWLVNTHAGRLIEDGVIEDPCIGVPFETRLLKL